MQDAKRQKGPAISVHAGVKPLSLARLEEVAPGT